MSVVSTATLKTDLTKRILDTFAGEFAKHGIDCERPNEATLHMSYLDCHVDLDGQADALQIRIETPSENLLSQIRDELIERIEDVDAGLAKTIRWSGEIGVGSRPGNFRVLQVLRRQEVMPGLIRVTLEGSDVAALGEDGIHIKLMMPLQHGRPPVWPTVAENGSVAWPRGDDELHARFVTIRSLRLEAREIDVDIAHHSGGLISDWAAMSGSGDAVGIMGPGGDPALPKSDGVVLAGDYTGIAGVARLLESVDGRATGLVVGAAPSQEALKAYLPETTASIVALPPEDFAGRVAEVVRAHGSEHSVQYGWFGGAFETAQALRTVFKTQFGLAKHDQLSVAYWRAGEPGHSSRAL